MHDLFHKIAQKTTIVTFLMLFLIQNTQNRDARVIHLKLDELIRVTKSARNHPVDLEDMTDEEDQEFGRGVSTTSVSAVRDDSRKLGRRAKIVDEVAATAILRSFACIS